MIYRTLIVNLICYGYIVIPLLSSGQVSDLQYRYINNEILNLDVSYPTSKMRKALQYEHTDQIIRKEHIEYKKSGLIKLSYYNQEGNLIKDQTYQNDILKKQIIYSYYKDGKILQSERGSLNIDYHPTYTSEHIKHYIGILPDSLEGNPRFRRGDTIVLEVSRYKIETEKKIFRRHNPPTRKTVEVYDRWGILKEERNYKNGIKSGHLETKTDSLGRPSFQENFAFYDFFHQSSGFNNIGNQVRTISYKNNLISTIKNEFYRPDKREWEVTLKNFDCTVEEKRDKIVLKCPCEDSNKDIEMHFDPQGNWTYKFIPDSNGEDEVIIRELTYYD